MTWIKICGITNLEDAQTAIEAGADALGFVFHETSPRFVPSKVAREIGNAIPATVERVGVFVANPEERVIDTFNEARLTAMQCHLFEMMQPHGQQKAFGSGCYWTAPRIYWCLSARLLSEDEQRRTRLMAGLEYLLDSAPPNARESMRAQGFQPTFFLDSGTPEKPGGTGATFDWHLALPWVDAMKKSVNVVVAGGLTPNNVGNAIAVLKPFGVDVSSGVEARPGKKDPEKVRAFIRAVREADKVV